MNVVSAWPEGFGRLHHASIDSTNEEARRLALAGERGPLWISADMQTKGRGRRGRAWQSPAGNLAATLLLRPNKPAAECAQLSFVTALSAYDMLGCFTSVANIELKWPNDVLLGRRKVAGVLLESASGAGGDSIWLAIGVGVNLAHFPEGTEWPATSLAAAGADVPSAATALTALAASFARWYETWTRRGFRDIRHAWLARAAGLRGSIRARLQNEEISGVFEGIDEQGALMLLTSDGSRHVIAAGDVFFS